LYDNGENIQRVLPGDASPGSSLPPVGELDKIADDYRRIPSGRLVAVRSKADYWQVPITEEVPETHLCPEYERRVPGTGYRG
jgi:hypothetical protein